MNAMYDVICSAVIAGVVLAMLVGFNGNIAESAAAQTVKVLTQTNLTTVTKIIENDFRRIGYGIYASPADSGIFYATDSSVTLKGGFGPNGEVGYVRYLWCPSENSYLPNKNTHVLHRIYNGTDNHLNVGVTHVKFQYYESNGWIDNIITASPVPSPSKIRTIKVILTVESTVPYTKTNEQYVKFNPGVCWERTFRPLNLR